MTTARDKFFYTRTLCSLLKALEGIETEIELRNDTHVKGTVELVGGDMSVTMCNCELIVAGRLKRLQRLFVQGRKIRMVMIPDDIDMIDAMQGVIKMFGAPAKGRNEFKKVSRGKGCSRDRGLGRGKARGMFDRGRARGLRGRGGATGRGAGGRARGVTEMCQGTTSDRGAPVKGRGFVGRGRSFVHRGRGPEFVHRPGRNTFPTSSQTVDDSFQNQKPADDSRLGSMIKFPPGAKETPSQVQSADAGSDNRGDVRIGSMLYPDYIYNKSPQQTPKTGTVSASVHDDTEREVDLRHKISTSSSCRDKSHKTAADSSAQMHSPSQTMMSASLSATSADERTESGLQMTDLRNRIRKGVQEEKSKSYRRPEKLPSRNVHDSRAEASHHHDYSPKRHFAESSRESKSLRRHLPKSGNSTSEHRSSGREESPSERRHREHSSQSRQSERDYHVPCSSKHCSREKQASPSRRHYTGCKDITRSHRGESPNNSDPQSRSRQSSLSSSKTKTSRSSSSHYQDRSSYQSSRR